MRVCCCGSFVFLNLFGVILTCDFWILALRCVIGSFGVFVCACGFCVLRFIYVGDLLGQHWNQCFVVRIQVLVMLRCLFLFFVVAYVRWCFRWGHWGSHVQFGFCCVGVIALFAFWIHIGSTSPSHGNHGWRFTVRINVSWNFENFMKYWPWWPLTWRKITKFARWREFQWLAALLWSFLIVYDL